MPTGYTAKLYDGVPVSFVDFVMEGARAFGFAVEQREEGPGPVKPPTPHTYYQESYEKKRQEAAEWDSLTPDERRVKYEEYAYQTRQHNIDSLKDAAPVRRRYSEMKRLLQEWQPDPLMNGVKEFLISQIEECEKTEGKPYISKVTPYDEWVTQQDEWNARMVERYRQEAEDEKVRNAERLAYYEALIESLEGVDNPVVS